MTNDSTSDQVLSALHAYGLADEGGGKYRADSPLRPGSNSHAFSLKIDGPEHGTWHDHVTGESGSLYELAEKLGIATPKAAQLASTKRGYTGLADYAQAHGVTAAAYANWGWAETVRDGRPALQFPTASGPRWRFLDDQKPPFTSPAGYQPCWYGLQEAAILAQASGQPLVLTNGEPSVIAAQAHGVAAASITNSGERALPASLLAELKAAWTGPILIALDCDQKGRLAAPKLAAQVGGQVVDLGGSAGFDLADFCRLHGLGSAAELARRAQPAPSAPAQPAAPGVPPTVSARILTTLAHLGHSFRLNLLSDDIEISGGLYTDIHRSQIRTALRDLGFRNLGAVDDTIVTEAARNAYHPIRQYLDALVWDGTPRIATLAQCFRCTDPAIVYADGRTRPLFDVYLERWLIGAVAKVYAQAQNLMLVLAGPQGIGKSAFPRWLCSPLPHLHLEAPIDVGDKDTNIRLMTRWIWEVSELDATTRKSDVAALKDFITREVVTVRKAYGRHDVLKPATASLVGTVNESEGFLADPTGNRRFLVASIAAIDWSYTTIDVGQLWAEAVYCYRAGEPWRLTREEADAQAAANRGHELGDPIEGWIDRYFICGIAHDPEGMTTADIIDHLRSKQAPINGDRSWETRIGAVLRKRGIVKTRPTSGDRTRRYYGITTK